MVLRMLILNQWEYFDADELKQQSHVSGSNLMEESFEN